MVIFLYFNVCITTKILIQDPRLRLKELIYFVLTGIFIEISAWLLTSLFPYAWGSNLIDLPALLLLSLYLHKGKAYCIKKAITLVAAAALITAVLDMAISSVLYAISEPIHIAAPDTTATAITLLVYGFFALILLFILSILSTTFLVKFSQVLRRLINQNQHMQTALLCTVLFLAVSFNMSISVMVSMGRASPLFVTNFIFFVAYIGVASVAFILFAKSLETKFQAQYKLQQKEIEHQALNHYTAELEHQQTAMRKFKHDYQNILFSIKTFLHERNIDGLTQYYEHKIEPASQIITHSDLALESLSKIKVSEIKSILAAKLMLAQNMNMDIVTSFEANEDINHIPLDSIALVRMLGILLDNAIEELQELEQGALMVGFFKEKAYITIIVQNSCRPDTPEVHQLKQNGFSTKGENRGLGLSNLSEIANANANVTLETAIMENAFVQRLYIQEGV
ncbi:MAG: GHKL domain-containing protein [Oscillospiraceae bacterium]|nr:GHKL domain-containing protein [Oscillospiraceae bacterium]